MFLKSLEIFGFKSFADRTRVEFADGITALLGPNGCGKSNVVDSIKWVVGEQAAKTLRAEKMEDVIFNGTENRKPLNVAEVTIVISNEAGLLKLDASEVAIKRRLYRSGESEYWINGQQVKLKDLRELFWDTGVGKSAYSVMEQGKIDQILSSKPEERRYLFEEAAGITRHKVRSREAESKLERTEENMRQAELLQAEVKRSYESLKVQCEKTLRYRSLKEETFNLELDLTLLRLRGFSEEHGRRSESIKRETERRDAVKSQIDAINAELERNLDQVNSMQTRINELQKETYGLAVEMAGKERHRKLIQERVQEAKGKIDASRLRLKAAQERLDNLLSDRDDKQAALRDLTIRIGEIEKNATEFEGRIREAGERIRANEGSVGAEDRRILELDAQETGLRTELESITEDIVAELDRRLTDSGYSSAERRRAEAALEEALSSLQVMLSGRAGLFSDWLLSPSPQEAEVRQRLERAKETAEDALSRVQGIKGLLDGYRATSPSFLDDFLSPEGIITKKRGIDEKIAAIRSGVESSRERIRALQEENRALTAKSDEYRATLEELRLNHMKMKTQVQGAEDAVRMLDREISGQENLAREIGGEIAMEERRLEESSEELSDLDSEIAETEKKGRELTEEITRIEKDISSRNSDVSSRQEESRAKIQSLASIQTGLEKLTLERAQMETEMRAVKDNFRETHSRDLMEFEERMYEIREQASDLREKLAAARAGLKELGSVNFMAPEEFAEVKERYEFLTSQLDDLKKARDDLFRITSEIRTESTELFLDTYNKIKKNFHNMFRRLFGGGRAELRLEDPEHVLESGIDIYAQPPGKRLENISLLSGGEKSMTAVALLFATYMVKPSPFCFLDEIDAALDEQNVLRFTQALRDFGKTSQFVVITHNKKTVLGASTLLGVTMEESGITKMITMRLENAPEKPVEPVSSSVEFMEEDVAYEGGTELPSEEELAFAKKQKARERKAAKAAAESLPESPETETVASEGSMTVTAEGQAAGESSAEAAVPGAPATEDPAEDETEPEEPPADREGSSVPPGDRLERSADATEGAETAGESAPDEGGEEGD